MADVLKLERQESGGTPRSRLAELEDAELVERYLEGNGRAFQVLADRYHDRLLNFIYRTIGDRDRSEDLVQETFVRVYRHLHRYDPTKKFSTWIYTIASNLAKNELRNRSRNPMVLFQAIKKNWDADHRPLQWEDSSYSPDDLYRKRHLREKVEEAVEQLPEHHRVVFVLREMEGKTYEEISEITGVTLGTVKSRLNRARNKFAQIVAPMLE
jgi:RNA polymerase sigma-70 factor (ECF subfamily)